MTAVARNHLSDEGKEAARILDLAKAGGDVPDTVITWALWALGDLVGVR